MRSIVLGLSLLAVVSATVYFKEEFGEGWEKRWVASKHDSNYGKFVASPGKYYGDKERDTGLKTSQDARFYAISSKLQTPFSNKGKDLVVQYTVKHEQKIDCGGGYLKLSPSNVDQSDFHGETVYNIMFGPDICGATKRTHLIFNYKGENHLRTQDIRTESDELTHLFALVVHPDQTYEVLIDQKNAASGNLVDDFKFLPPKEIKDPSVSKPADWVDEATIADPEDVKPADWDDVPEFIADPDAQKPEDWDDEDDGEWEAPSIPNPDFKGVWEPKQIPNPAYKGEWVHPVIANPEYKEDNEIYAFADFGVVGIDIWQVKSGSIFDNIIITDSEEEAREFAKETLEKTKKGEKEMKDKQDEQEKKEREERQAKEKAELDEANAKAEAEGKILKTEDEDKDEL